ncbi:MAG: phosphoribosyltransferase [Planctomycetota bacterium]
MKHVRTVVGRPRAAFRDRQHAGRELADYLLSEGAAVDAVMAVPSGGVAAARSLSERLGVPFDLVLVRKLPLPMAPEAGFGAVALGGEVVLNEHLVAAWGLSEEVIHRVVGRVRRELRGRQEKFLGNRPRVDPAGAHILVVDDGLASGYTMRVAVRELWGRGSRTVAVAVPHAPLSTIGEIDPLADELYCLFAQRGGSFAVASYYESWHDLSDEEVLELLSAAGEGRAPGAEP